MSQDISKVKPMSLVEACQADEPWAWRQMVDTWASAVYRWCVLLGLSARDAEDAVQDVFATASERMNTCTCDEVLGSWLYQITRRHAANRRRLAWCKKVFFMEDEQTTAFAPGRNVDDELEVRNVLSRLPMRHVEVLVLMDVEGFTRRETAEILDLAEPAVASRLRRAREAFRAAYRRPAPIAELEPGA